MTRFALVAAVVLAAPLLSVPAALAAPPEDPHGVGVCISQLAIDPSLDGVANLGEAIRSLATPGEPGSGIPAAHDGVRGDGPSGCGGPPGPGHLGG